MITVSSIANLRDVIRGQDVTWHCPIFQGVPAELSHVAVGMERRSGKEGAAAEELRDDGPAAG